MGPLGYNRSGGGAATLRVFALHAPPGCPTIRPPRSQGSIAGRARSPWEGRMSADPPAPPSLVRRLLVALVACVCRHPRLVLVTALGLCAISAVAASTRLQYHTSRNDLISARKDYQQRWGRYVAEFGDDDDIVVVVKGADRERMKDALDAVARRLAAQPHHFDRLFYKVDLAHLRDRALLLAPYDQVRTI